MEKRAWKVVGLAMFVGGTVAFAQTQTAAPAPAGAPAGFPGMGGGAGGGFPAMGQGGAGGGFQGMGMGMTRQTPQEMLDAYDVETKDDAGKVVKAKDKLLDLDELVAMQTARFAGRRTGAGAGGPGAGAGPAAGAGGPGAGAGRPAADPAAMAERAKTTAQQQLDTYDVEKKDDAGKVVKAKDKKLDLEELTAMQAATANRRGAGAPGAAGGAGGGFPAMGQGAGGPGAGAGGGFQMPPEMLEQYDTDKDGQLSETERAAMMEGMRSRMGGQGGAGGFGGGRPAATNSAPGAANRAPAAANRAPGAANRAPGAANRAPAAN